MIATSLLSHVADPDKAHGCLDSYFCPFPLFQIKHMVAFIEQEAKEKADEILAKVRADSRCKLAIAAMVSVTPCSQ